jgi:hypothetical protein
MSEVESDDSFVFVDKRKVGAEPSVEAEDAGSDADADGVDEAVDADAGSDDAADSVGSYGLVAYVIGLIASDAWQKMGLIAEPGSGKVVKDLKQARFSIDCVAALVGVADQSGDPFPAELRRDLQRVLGDLRLNFVEQSRRN